MAKVKELSGYELSRDWWNWAFENPEIISPNHSALYFFIIEHCNRLGWKEKFGLPTSMAKDAIGIKHYNTYSKTLKDLEDWGFIKMIERSKNQYSANIVALSKNDKAYSKALDKAFIKHVTKHTSKQSESTRQSKCTVDKPLTKEPIKPLTKEPKNKEPEAYELLIFPTFQDFWDLYEKKTGMEKSMDLWEKVSQPDREKIMEHIPLYKIAEPNKKYRKNPTTYLNQKAWNDEIIQSNDTNNTNSGKPDRLTNSIAELERFHRENQ